MTPLSLLYLLPSFQGFVCPVMLSVPLCQHMAAGGILERCLAGNYLEAAAFHAWGGELMAPSTSNGKDHCSLLKEACDSGWPSFDMGALVALQAFRLVLTLSAEAEDKVCGRETLGPGSEEAALRHSCRSCMAHQEQCRWLYHIALDPSASVEVGAWAYCSERSYFGRDPDNSGAARIPLSATSPEEVRLRKYWHTRHLVEGGSAWAVGDLKVGAHSIDLVDCSLPYSMKR